MWKFVFFLGIISTGNAVDEDDYGVTTSASSPDQTPVIVTNQSLVLAEKVEQLLAKDPSPQVDLAKDELRRNVEREFIKTLAGFIVNEQAGPEGEVIVLGVMRSVLNGELDFTPVVERLPTILRDSERNQFLNVLVTLQESEEQREATNVFRQQAEGGYQTNNYIANNLLYSPAVERYQQQQQQQIPVKNNNRYPEGLFQGSGNGSRYPQAPQQPNRVQSQVPYQPNNQGQFNGNGNGFQPNNQNQNQYNNNNNNRYQPSPPQPPQGPYNNNGYPSLNNNYNNGYPAPYPQGQGQGQGAPGQFNNNYNNYNPQYPSYPQPPPAPAPYPGQDSGATGALFSSLSNQLQQLQFQQFQLQQMLQSQNEKLTMQEQQAMMTTVRPTGQLLQNLIRTFTISQLFTNLPFTLVEALETGIGSIEGLVG